MSKVKRKKVVIIGAGPAGLTAGIELLKTEEFAVNILEREAVVGGLARTTDYKGYKFDIGPHHFITDSPKIEQWWKDLMGRDFITLQRYTRIFYNRHFFMYPLEAWNVIRGLRFFECVRCVLSYVKYRFFPIKKVQSFQDWVTNKFGYRLFSIFFKTYTEKVWGIPCNKISSDWAAQRIKGFNMSKAIFYGLFGRWFKKNAPRTLRDTFYYPPKGAGTMWEKVADNICFDKQGAILLEEDVVTIKHNGSKITSVYTTKQPSVKTKEFVVEELLEHAGDYFMSTMPLKTLILAMDPLPPRRVLAAAKCLGYRGLITVNLVVNKKEVIPDHWLYVHEKAVRMGRIGNMNNFSLEMVANPNHTALSLEYFAFADEPLWHKADAELIELGTKELAQIGLVAPHEVLDGMVMRSSEAYPVYDEHYQQHLNGVLDYLGQFSNLQLMGRNGMHRYNNQDIAMLSAMQAVDAIVRAEQSSISVPPISQQSNQRMA